MGPELLLGVHFSLPDSDPQINYQRAVASLRGLAYQFRRNVLEQLVYKSPEELIKDGIRNRSGRRENNGIEYLYRNYFSNGLFISYICPELRGPEDAVIIRRMRNGQRIELGINPVHAIQVVSSDLRSNVTHRLELSTARTDLRCDISVDCSSGSYQRVVSPKTEDPGISNATTLIRDVAQQVVGVLS